MATGNLSMTVAELWRLKSPEIIRISRICVNNRPQEYTAIRAAYLPIGPQPISAGRGRRVCPTLTSLQRFEWCVELFQTS